MKSQSYEQNAFFLDSNASTRDVALNRQFTNSGKITFAAQPLVYGAAISGHVTLENASDSYVRIVLVDAQNKSYLLYEAYPLIVDSLSFSLDHLGLETLHMPGVTPAELQILVYKASLQIESIAFNYSNVTYTAAKARASQSAQQNAIIDKLNENLSAQNAAWRAGMTSMAQMTYEEKLNFYGGTIPLTYGFEYYVGGIYTPSSSTLQQNTLYDARNSQVDEIIGSYCDIDWRCRHGRDWTTPAKSQMKQTCWIYGTISHLESFVNVYYNDTINYDLSELNIFTNTTHANYDWAGYVYKAYDRLKSYGTVLEDCHPFHSIADSMALPCDSPSEIVSISNYKYTYNIYSANQISNVYKALYKAPMGLVFEQQYIKNDSVIWGSHHVLLAGKKTLQVGDSIYQRPMNTVGCNPITVIDTNSPLYGKTAWLIKNSYGTNWGDNGFCYVIPDSSMNFQRAYEIYGAIHSLLMTDEDIRVADQDGDGFYTWGSGNRPTSLPEWAENEQDADDTNPMLGAANDFGFPQPIEITSLTIQNEQKTIDSPCILNNNIIVGDGGVLSIQANVKMHPNTLIQVQNGGKLLIPHGILSQSRIRIKSGGRLEIYGTGHVELSKMGNLLIEQGGSCIMLPGSSIKNQ